MAFHQRNEKNNAIIVDRKMIFVYIKQMRHGGIAIQSSVAHYIAVQFRRIQV